MIIHMDEEQKRKIIKVLQDKGAVLPCSRCGSQKFTLIDGYFNQPLQQHISNNLIIGGSSIPLVGVVCDRCGFIAYHAIGALGLMPQAEENKHDTEQPATSE